MCMWDAQLGEFKSTSAGIVALSKQICRVEWMVLWLEMPLRRNCRQYGQLSDNERGRILGLRETGPSNRRMGRHFGRSNMVVVQCWQQWVTKERINRRGGSGGAKKTNENEKHIIMRMITFALKNVASIDSMSVTSFKTSSCIKGNHKETTGQRWHKELTSLKIPAIDPHHKQSRLDFCRPRAT